MVKQKEKMSWVVVVHHLGGRGRQISEFEASLVYKVSSRTARAIQKNPVSREREREREREKERDLVIWLVPSSGPHAGRTLYT
jgi:hypothetical protein